MFGINVVYTTKPGKREELLAALAACGLPEAVRRETGCIQYDYYLSVEDPDRVLLLEKWSDRNAQKVHLTQPHMAQLAAIKKRCIAGTAVETYEL